VCHGINHITARNNTLELNFGWQKLSIAHSAHSTSTAPSSKWKLFSLSEMVVLASVVVVMKRGEEMRKVLLLSAIFSHPHFSLNN
jgi:hypothetical protein